MKVKKHRAFLGGAAFYKLCRKHGCDSNFELREKIGKDKFEELAEKIRNKKYDGKRNSA